MFTKYLLARDFNIKKEKYYNLEFKERINWIDNIWIEFIK
jgi:hypothetical protein